MRKKSLAAAAIPRHPSRMDSRSRRLCAGLLMGASLSMPGTLSTESLTLTTYYPSPYGVYDQLRAVKDSFFAYQGGRVGIGTTTPASKLSVAGDADMEGLRVAGHASVGTLRIAAGAADGYVLEADASGNARWAEPKAAPTCYFPTVSMSARKSVRVACVSGYQMYGGGFRVPSVRIRSSYPLDRFTWACTLSEKTTNALCYAVCCK